MMDIIKEFFGYGPIGLVAAASLFLYWRERKRNEEIQEDRLNDVKEQMQSLNDLEQALQNLVVEFRSKLDQILRELE